MIIDVIKWNIADSDQPVIKNHFTINYYQLAIGGESKKLISTKMLVGVDNTLHELGLLIANEE